MGYEEAVLPGCGLGVGAAHLEAVEGRIPVAVAPLAAEEAGVAIEHVDVALCTLIVALSCLLLAHGLRHAGNTPVVVGILQQAGD